MNLKICISFEDIKKSKKIYFYKDFLSFIKILFIYLLMIPKLLFYFLTCFNFFVKELIISL
jgi:hypothetical protein